MIIAPIAMAVPFDWRALVVATLGGIMTLLTNPRLVPGLSYAMPAAGSSAVLPSARDASKGAVNGWLLAVLAGVGLGLCVMFAWTSRAHAQTVEPVTPQLGGVAYCDPLTGACKLTWQPAGMVTVLQRNLSTGNTERLALAVGYSVVWHGSIDLGVAAYGGVGLSQSQPDAPQGDIMFQLGGIGAIGFGVETYSAGGARVYQGLFNLAINYNVGGSPGYVQKAAASAVREDRKLQSAKAAQ
jgi:hypothetical protein